MIDHDRDDYVFAEVDEKYREPEEVYDCGHQQSVADAFNMGEDKYRVEVLKQEPLGSLTNYGLRKEYDLLDGITLKWSSAILCVKCKDSIDNNPDDPREVFPSGTRED